MPEFSVALGKKKTKFLASWLLRLSNMNYVKLQVCCENQLRCHMSVVLPYLGLLWDGAQEFEFNKSLKDAGAVGSLPHAPVTCEKGMRVVLALLYKSMELISYILFLRSR